MLAVSSVQLRTHDYLAAYFMCDFVIFVEAND